MVIVETSRIRRLTLFTRSVDDKHRNRRALQNAVRRVSSKQLPPMMLLSPDDNQVVAMIPRILRNHLRCESTLDREIQRRRVPVLLLKFQKTILRILAELAKDLVPIGRTSRARLIDK